jgi:hypothetical protein
MSTVKTLLFPFATDSPYFDGYSWSLSLAARMGGTLQLLAAAPEFPTSAERANTIYCSRLEAHGHYLEHYHQHHWKKPVIKLQMLPDNRLVDGLLNYLEHQSPDIIILDWSFCEKSSSLVKNLIKSNARLILLPAPQKKGRSASSVDSFYDQLLVAEISNDQLTGTRNPALTAPVLSLRIKFYLS